MQFSGKDKTESTNTEFGVWIKTNFFSHKAKPAPHRKECRILLDIIIFQESSVIGFGSTGKKIKLSSILFPVVC